MNPSDECYIEGDDFKTVCLATAILGDGFYGLQEVGGELTMPPINFANGWFESTFDQNIGNALNGASKEDLANVLSTVELNGVRSSLNDIEGRAKEYVLKLRGCSA